MPAKASPPGTATVYLSGPEIAAPATAASTAGTIIISAYEILVIADTPAITEAI
jgi:hypothetical protein